MEEIEHGQGPADLAEVAHGQGAPEAEVVEDAELQPHARRCCGARRATWRGRPSKMASTECDAA